MSNGFGHHDQQQRHAPAPATPGSVRLGLPTFGAPAATAPAGHPYQHRVHHPQQQPQPQPQPQYQHQVVRQPPFPGRAPQQAARQVVQMHQPAYAWHPHPQAQPAPQMVPAQPVVVPHRQASFRPAPPARHVASRVAARPLTPTPRSFQPATSHASLGVLSADGESKITPVHVGILLTLVVFAWVISHGPQASFNTNAPAALPALSPSAETLPLKPDAAASAAPAAKARPAAAGARRGGSVTTRTEVLSSSMRGMPTPAAVAKLRPQTLPLRPQDGMTLPLRSGERDSHATDTHYGGASRSSTLPMEPVEPTVATPGDSAEYTRAAANADVDGYPAGPAAGANHAW